MREEVISPICASLLHTRILAIMLGFFPLYLEISCSSYFNFSVQILCSTYVLVLVPFLLTVFSLYMRLLSMVPKSLIFGISAKALL